MATMTKEREKKASKSSLKLQPLGDRVVVRREEGESRTAGGIVLPDAAKEKPTRGVIEAVGSGITDLQVGDEVMAWEAGPGFGGAFAEHVEVPRSHVGKKPKNLSLEEASSMPYVPLSFSHLPRIIPQPDRLTYPKEQPTSQQSVS